MQHVSSKGRVSLIGAVLLVGSAACGIDQSSLAPVGRSQDVQKSEITFAQIDAWFRDASARVMSDPDAIYIDHEEEVGKIRLGIRKAADHARFWKLLAPLRLPDGVVEIEETEPFGEAIGQPLPTPATSIGALRLTDLVRPVIGGLQYKSYNGTAFVWECTLGFSAFNPPDTRASFIVNSHCTVAMNNIVNKAIFHQPTSFATIGVETEDPAVLVPPPSGCPPGAMCRYSDAARAVYGAGVPYDLGGIAQTTSAGTTLPAPVDIAGTFRIVGEGPSIPMETACKVGHISGWTCGKVVKRGVNVNIYGTTMIGQDVVAAYADNGDSGAPVFVQVPGTNNVILRGILIAWALAPRNPNLRLFAFSPIANIESELGPLTTF